MDFFGVMKGMDRIYGDAMNRVCTVMWGNLEIIKNGYGKI